MGGTLLGVHIVALVRIVLEHIVLVHTVLERTVLVHKVLEHTVLKHTVLVHTVLVHKVLVHTGVLTCFCTFSSMCTWYTFFFCHKLWRDVLTDPCLP